MKRISIAGTALACLFATAASAADLAPVKTCSGLTLAGAPNCRINSRAARVVWPSGAFPYEVLTPAMRISGE